MTRRAITWAGKWAGVTREQLDQVRPRWLFGRCLAAERKFSVAFVTGSIHDVVPRAASAWRRPATEFECAHRGATWGKIPVVSVCVPLSPPQIETQSKSKCTESTCVMDDDGGFVQGGGRPGHQGFTYPSSGNSHQWEWVIWCRCGKSAASTFHSSPSPRPRERILTRDNFLPSLNWLVVHCKHTHAQSFSAGD